MKLSRKQRRELRINKLHSQEAELNIVSMIDVFAVLVFFLLVSSSIVAARLNVISLNLPEQTNAPPPPPKEEPLALTIVIRQGGLTLSSSRGSHTLPNTPGGYDLQSLSNFLVDIKRRSPKEQDITLLLEPDIPYDDLVRIMDTARVAPAEAKAQGMTGEMFPNIALGDARMDGAPAAPAAAPAPGGS